MKEIWKDIIGYEGLYKISNYGNVKHHKNGKKVCSDNGHGYMSTMLSKNSKNTNYYIHRLVALHFIENPENKPEVNHKNSVRNDNRVDNLEWCTRSENQLHSYKYGFNKQTPKRIANSIKQMKRINRLGLVNLGEKPILQYDLDGNFIREYKSMNEASRHGFHISALVCVCKGRRNQTGGFKWKYKGDEAR